jgi:hypothetical protein
MQHAESGGYWRVAASLRCDANTAGNTIRLDPTVATVMDVVNCAKPTSAACADGYHGSVALTCEVAWGEFEVSGCSANTCTWPTLPTGYALHDSTCGGRKLSDSHYVPLAICDNIGYIRCVRATS